MSSECHQVLCDESNLLRVFHSIPFTSSKMIANTVTGLLPCGLLLHVIIAYLCAHHIRRLTHALTRWPARVRTYCYRPGRLDYIGFDETGVHGSLSAVHAFGDTITDPSVAMAFAQVIACLAIISSSS